MFPYTPKEGEDERLFRIGDPWGLREKVIPLFEMCRETHRVSGLATAFRIDPFGTYLTAHHAFEIGEGQGYFDSRQLGTVFGLFSPGLVFGASSIPKECFVFLERVNTFRGLEESPLIHEPPRSKNIFDCAQIFFQKGSKKLAEHNRFLPIQLGGNRPQVGDKVMAIGYPGVMKVKNADDASLTSFTEGLYGAIGTVKAVHTAGLAASRPWPTFEVATKWPGGMSGGPIFNEQGNVIGLVSSSIDDGEEADGVGLAFWFQPIWELRNWLPTIDADNPGCIMCWAVIRSAPRHLAGIFANRSEADLCQQKLGQDYEVKWGSNRFGSDDFMSIQNIKA